jgi:hypothetical protein
LVFKENTDFGSLNIQRVILGCKEILTGNKKLQIEIILWILGIPRK